MENEIQKYGDMVRQIPVQRQIRKDWQAQRAVQMAKQYFDDSRTLQSIGDEHSLSRQRVHSIINSLKR